MGEIMALIGMEIAVLVVTISIVLSGIVIGLGRGIGVKRIELFGLEELMQSIINGAIVGSAAAIVEVIKNISSSVVEPLCSDGDVLLELTCIFQSLSAQTFLFFQELVKMSNLVGYYQSLSLDFQAFAIQPLVNLASVSDIIGIHLVLTNMILILLNLNLQIIGFFSTNALGLIFPLGLVFRSFFATRKLGGFLIALAIGLYVFYPTFILLFPSPIEEVEMTTLNITEFTNSSMYAAYPIVDLNDNNAIAQKFDEMSEADFSGDITEITQGNTNLISKLTFYSVFAPLFSLIVTIIFIKELGSILGGEMKLNVGVI